MIAARCDGFQNYLRQADSDIHQPLQNLITHPSRSPECYMSQSRGCTYSLDQAARIRQEGNFTTCILQDIPRCK